MTQTAPHTSGASTIAPDIPSPTESPENTTEPELALTPRRRLLTSIFIIALLVSSLSVVMPNSEVKAGLLTVTRPLVAVAGLEQRWGMFAPNPRNDSSYVYARTDNADGSFDIYAVDNAAGVSEYWNYRWRKYAENLWTDPKREKERATFATWVVRHQRDNGRNPVRVSLFRHSVVNLPPGPGPDYGPPRDIQFFTASVGAS